MLAQGIDAETGVEQRMLFASNDPPLFVNPPDFSRPLGALVLQEILEHLCPLAEKDRGLPFFRNAPHFFPDHFLLETPYQAAKLLSALEVPVSERVDDGLHHQEDGLGSQHFRKLSRKPRAALGPQALELAPRRVRRGHSSYQETWASPLPLGARGAGRLHAPGGSW